MEIERSSRLKDGENFELKTYSSGLDMIPKDTIAITTIASNVDCIIEGKDFIHSFLYKKNRRNVFYTIIS